MGLTLSVAGVRPSTANAPVGGAVDEARRLAQQEVGDALRIVEVEQRQALVGSGSLLRAVGADCDHVRSCGYCTGAPSAGRQISIFGSAARLKPSTSTQSQSASSAISWCTVGLGVRLELADLGQPTARRDHHLEGAGLAVAPGVLAFVVDVERVVRVLDHRHALAGRA